MLARRLSTLLPAMHLAQAIEITRIHRVTGLTVDRTALVTTRLCRAPHHTISDVGLIGGGQVPMPGKVSLPTTASSSWMNGPSSAAMSWRSCASRSRTTTQACHLASVLDLTALDALGV
jgi:Magnesium chelatase, subunit ChlI